VADLNRASAFFLFHRHRSQQGSCSDRNCFKKVDDYKSALVLFLSLVVKYSRGVDNTGFARRHKICLTIEMNMMRSGCGFGLIPCQYQFKLVKRNESKRSNIDEVLQF